MRREEIERRLAVNAAIVYRAAAEAIRPDPREWISEWAAKHRIVPEGASVKPGRWNNALTPELVEPMDCLSPRHPCELVVIGKPAQSGGSASAENFLGFIMHRAPGPAMYVSPTLKLARDWKNEKLDPMIAATPVLAPPDGVVKPQKARSGEGSTAERIKFKGGYILLAGANSAASLRQHSIRYMVRDDRAGWTGDAEEEGSPLSLANQRLKTYRAFGLAKVADISTFLEKGDAFDRDMQKTDVRRYYMACLGCGALTDFDWEDVQKEPAAPFRCRVTCPSCGREHVHADKADMKAPANGACWIPTAPDVNGVVPPKTIPADEREAWRNRDTVRTIPGFWLTGVVNSFDTWDLIAAEEANAGDDPDLLKPFVNGILGRPYETKGDGPGWEALAARREAEFERGHAPAGVLYVTFTADVQADGLYWQFLGWGPNKECWHIDYGFEAGLTDVPLEGAWPKLDMIVDNGVSLGGARVQPDMIAVDSGYNVDAAYSWVKRRHNALAVRGMEGWTKLPIYRAESPDVKKKGLSAGKARRYGMKVWLVGTYAIKGALMNYLGRTPREGAARLPKGYQHFPGNAEQEYFEQLVSEYVKVEEVRGEPVRKWGKRGPNHWLDCTVYAWALTHYVGMWNWDEARWDGRAADLAKITGAPQRDLFVPVSAARAARPLDDDPGDEPTETPRVVKQSDRFGLGSLAEVNKVTSSWPT